MQLVEWTGTLILVSHDRVFLDNVVTSTLAFEGDGRVVEYVGGYEDWLRQRPAPDRSQASVAVPTKPSSLASQASPVSKKLSYKEQRELETLPGRIEALEAEQATLHVAVHLPDFYREGAEAIARTLARVAAVEEELLAALARWDELVSRQSP